MDSHPHRNTVSCCSHVVMKDLRETNLLIWQKERMLECMNDNAVNKMLEVSMSSGTVYQREKFITLMANTGHNSTKFPKYTMQEEMGVYSAVDTLGLHTRHARHEEDANSITSQSTAYLENTPDHMREGAMLSDTTLVANASNEDIHVNSHENEHDEFLEAAVSAAIQEKGLSL